MAYANQLTQEKFNELYDQLYQKSEQAAKAAYRQRLAKAKTSRQVKACAGVYPSDWSELFRQWVHGRASNLYVRECLKVGHVHSPEDLGMV